MRREETDQLFKCVWMTAGVLTYRLCDRGFDCEHCLVDLAMRRGSATVPEIEETVILPKSRASARSGRIKRQKVSLSPPRGFLHPAHLSLRVVGGGNVRVRVDAIARRLLGRPTSIDLPQVGTSVRGAQRVFRFRGTDGELVLPSPIDGRLLARNERLLEDPTQLRSGRRWSTWLVDLRPARLREDLARLFYGQRLKEWWREELDRLRERLIEFHSVTERTLPDGGEFDPRVLDDLDGERRRHLIDEFLLRKTGGGGGE